MQHEILCLELEVFLTLPRLINKRPIGGHWTGIFLKTYNYSKRHDTQKRSTNFNNLKLTKSSCKFLTNINQDLNVLLIKKERAILG